MTVGILLKNGQRLRLTNVAMIDAYEDSWTIRFDHRPYSQFLRIDGVVSWSLNAFGLESAKGFVSPKWEINREAAKVEV